MPKIAARGGQLSLSKCQPRLEAPTKPEHKQMVQIAKQKQNQWRHVHQGDTAPRTPQHQAFLEKPNGSQLHNNIPTFNETQRFISVFTTARHLPLSTARLIPVTCPYPQPD